MSADRKFENIQRAREQHNKLHIETVHREANEQLKELDKRLGKNQGAKKERKRLTERLV